MNVAIAFKDGRPSEAYNVATGDLIPNVTRIRVSADAEGGYFVAKIYTQGSDPYDAPVVRFIESVR